MNDEKKTLPNKEQIQALTEKLYHTLKEEQCTVNDAYAVIRDLRWYIYEKTQQTSDLLP